MWKTVIYVVLLLIGMVGFAYFLYVEIRNNKLREGGKEVRTKSYLIAIGIPVRCIAKLQKTTVIS
jgi:hypothetical protein